MREKNKTENKKIMLITPMLHQGGFERICVMTARALSQRRDTEAVIVVFSMEDIAFDISGLSVIDLNLKAKDGRLRKILNIIRRGIKLTVLQKKLGTDISYSFGTTANIANSLSRGAKKKISACHSFEEIRGGGYMRLISRCTDRVLCCSKKMADLVQESYGFPNAKALWNPCDIQGILAQSRKEPDKDIGFFRENGKILVSMGREDDVKGFWHLLKIFRRVYEEEENVGLAIIGEGGFEEYRRLAKELGVEKRVFFTGLKKNPFPYLRESDIYLLTSLSEGLPNALVEALALSLPVVSANCLSGPAEILHGDFREAEAQKEVFLGDYGILVPPLSPEKDLSVRWKPEGEAFCREEAEKSPCRGEKKRIVLEEAEEKFAGAVLRLLQ
ncbi:MAG: glycosyltransferase, partial [Lachnospiraceae bacterium]|nr:glycosyltransferase [Lachnospiraceae bacterium]